MRHEHIFCFFSEYLVRFFAYLIINFILGTETMFTRWTLSNMMDLHRKHME